jgi:hypothetical protein
MTLLMNLTHVNSEGVKGHAQVVQCEEVGFSELFLARDDCKQE